MRLAPAFQLAIRPSASREAMASVSNVRAIGPKLFSPPVEMRTSRKTDGPRIRRQPRIMRPRSIRTVNDLARSLCALQRRHVPLQPRSQVSMRAARQQPCPCEHAKVPRRRAGEKPFTVANHVVATGERLEEGHAFEHLADADQAGPDLGGREVMQYVGA